jgi:hypothetical protein
MNTNTIVVLILSLVSGTITPTPTIRERVNQQIAQCAQNCDRIRQEQIDRASYKHKNIPNVPIEHYKLLQAIIEQEVWENIEQCINWKSKFHPDELVDCHNKIIKRLGQKYLSEPNHYHAWQEQQFKNTVITALDNTKNKTNQIIKQDPQFRQK